jgi:hypothetical protein
MYRNAVMEPRSLGRGLLLSLKKEHMGKPAHITYGDILGKTGKPVPEDAFEVQRPLLFRIVFPPKRSKSGPLLSIVDRPGNLEESHSQ